MASGVIGWCGGALRDSLPCGKAVAGAHAPAIGYTGTKLVNRPSEDFARKSESSAAGEDAAVSRALRWSIAALLIIVSATAFLLLKGTPPRIGDARGKAGGGGGPVT